MEVAQFHRAYWHYETNTGIGKIHHEPLGIIAFVFEDNVPKHDVNFLDEDEVKYYRQQYKKAGRPLTLGVQIDRDVELIRVAKLEDVFTLQEINLEIRVNGVLRHFRVCGSQEWVQISQDTPWIEYQRCDSLICVR